MISPDAQMIDRRILQEAWTLQDAGHAVTLLSGFECKTPDAYEERGVPVKRYVYDWTDIRRQALAERLGRRPARLLWPAVRLANRLAGGPTGFEAFVLDKILQHDFDVVHAHDLPVLRTAVMAAQRRGTPVVYDSHEFYPMQSVFGPRQQREYLALEKRLIRACAAVTTVNPYIADLMGKAYGIAPPAVLLNAVETPPAAELDRRARLRLDPAARAAARRAKGLPPDDFLFLYQGWISPERNIEALVRAMAHQPPGRSLIVVGYGEHVDALKQLADSLALGGRCLFYGASKAMTCRLSRRCAMSGSYPTRRSTRCTGIAARTSCSSSSWPGCRSSPATCRTCATSSPATASAGSGRSRTLPPSRR